MQAGVIDPHLASRLLAVFDLAGTFVFALSGATKAVEHKLDFFGVLVLCFAAGNSGGIARDIMIGAIPPAAIHEWGYLAVSVLAGVITFFWYPAINRLSSPVLLFDAAGLGLFVAAGADKALAFHAGPVAAILFGTLTGIGGGMARDLLVGETPAVLRTDIYAVAALIGASALVGARAQRLPVAAASVLGAVLCFGIRLGAMRYGWKLPAANPRGTGGRVEQPRDPEK
ncbi:MAG: trimeric intracellular cation channel family protein [Acidobacteriota bacterium]|nr:trimeric intracellular cation channel family protein [Acidobacteriota bacterium]